MLDITIDLMGLLAILLWLQLELIGHQRLYGKPIRSKQLLHDLWLLQYLLNLILRQLLQLLQYALIDLQSFQTLHQIEVFFFWFLVAALVIILLSTLVLLGCHLFQ